jgi:uncharacterized protein YdhG (YjbR/CyaY superfamily)
MADKKTTTRGSGAFTDEEKAAMQERAREAKAARKGKGKTDGRADLLAKIAEMEEDDRAMAERIDAIVLEAGPELESKTWYGMPAWARDGKNICFFTPAAKFKSRYASFGFEEHAHIDEGTMWATSFAITKLSAADEKRIAELVKRALG